MFKKRTLVRDPKVLIREEVPPSDFKFVVFVKQGDFYLVKPKVAREVYYLQLLGKNVSMFLPVDGEGLLVRKTDIDNL